jgi:hypothetical protein
MKRKELLRKEYLVILVLFVTVFVVIVGILPMFIEDEIQNCIEEKQRSDYNKISFPGQLTVSFKQTTSKEEAINMIRFYGLEENIETYYRQYTNVYVPTGSEYRWACVLERNDLVERVSFPSRTHKA